LEGRAQRKHEARFSSHRAVTGKINRQEIENKISREGWKRTEAARENVTKFQSTLHESLIAPASMLPDKKKKGGRYPGSARGEEGRRQETYDWSSRTARNSGSERNRGELMVTGVDLEKGKQS